MSLMSSFDYTFKVIIVGDSDVGKSCIVKRYVDDAFNVNNQITVGVDYGCKIIDLTIETQKEQTEKNNLTDNKSLLDTKQEIKKIKLSIWDTAGQEKFKSIVRSYYKNSHGILLCYDITSHESFKNIKQWLREVTDHTTNSVIILVGTKYDLNKERVIDIEEAEYLATVYGLKYIETSSKTNYQIEKCFMQLTCDIYKKYMEQHNNDVKIITKPVTGLELNNPTDTNNGKCCNSS